MGGKKPVGFIVIALVVIAIIGLVLYSRHGAQPAANSDNATSTEQNTDAILACYSQASGTAIQSIPNNSVQNVKETSRVFINMPKNLYPQDLKDSWTTISGNATASAVGGGFGNALDATSDCWSSYVDFEGSGEVDLHVKSLVVGTIDYFVRFIVSKA